MKLQSLALLLTAALLTVVGCSSSSSNVALEDQHRGVYLLFSPTKERMAKIDQIKQMFTYIINDMSPGDTLVVDIATAEPLHMDLSSDPARAYEQKRDFRQNLDTFLKNLKPTHKCQIDNALVRAKAHLAHPRIKHRSILLCSDAKVLKRRVKELNGFTVSLLNFIDKAKLDIDKIHQKIAKANGKLVVATQLTDLDKALAYR